MKNELFEDRVETATPHSTATSFVETVFLFCFVPPNGLCMLTRARLVTFICGHAWRVSKTVPIQIG